MKKGEPGQRQISVWVMTDDLRRADALVPKLAKERMVAALGKVTRSTVLRLAVAHGLDALEQKYN